jgi:hypothetical protein
MNPARNSLDNSLFNSMVGVEMFQAYDERKKALTEHTMLKNRLSKLIQEEINAKRKHELMQKRAEELLRQKERHLSFLMEKQRLKERRSQDEEDLRMKLNDLKRKEKEKIRKANQDLANSKLSLALEVKRQKKQNNDMFKKYLDIVHTQRYQNASLSKENKMKLVSQRSKSFLDHRNLLREEYLKTIQEHKNDYLRMVNEKIEMARIEAEMLQKISDTKNLEVRTLESIKNLQNVRSFSQTDNY